MKLKSFPALLSLFLQFCLALAAQTTSLVPGSVGDVELSLRKLNETGTMLMIAAHPDDERTNILAYYARGRHMRTAYLSITRGEGGQNLIGSDQGATLGVIRTQELLAARRIDGAEQFFSRAIDFGFSPPTNIYSLGNRVWLDDGTGGGLANNGLQDGTEIGEVGVTVNLLNSAGVTVLGGLKPRSIAR